MAATQAGPGQRQGAQPRDDVWLHSACDVCNSNCGVLVHRVNGVVVKIEGDPNCPQSAGKVCAKGNAALIGLYDPARVATPLKRTKPVPGSGHRKLKVRPIQ